MPRRFRGRSVMDESYNESSIHGNITSSRGHNNNGRYKIQHKWTIRRSAGSTNELTSNNIHRMYKQVNGSGADDMVGANCQIYDTTKSDDLINLKSEDLCKVALAATTKAYTSKPLTKVVVRLLPPTLKDEQFMQSLDETFRSKIVWYDFCPGKRRRLLSKPCTSSRAYLNFSTPSEASAFIKTFHSRPFIDDRGDTYRAVAVMAPFQKIPRPAARRRRGATTSDVITLQQPTNDQTVDSVDQKSLIEQNPLYLEFCESLKKGIYPIEVDTSETADIKVSAADCEDGITPLIQAIRDKSYRHRTLKPGNPDGIARRQNESTTTGKMYELSAAGSNNFKNDEMDNAALTGVVTRPVPVRVLQRAVAEHPKTLTTNRSIYAQQVDKRERTAALTNHLECSHKKTNFPVDDIADGHDSRIDYPSSSSTKQSRGVWRSVLDIRPTRNQPSDSTAERIVRTTNETEKYDSGTDKPNNAAGLPQTTNLSNLPSINPREIDPSINVTPIQGRVLKGGYFSGNAKPYSTRSSYGPLTTVAWRPKVKQTDKAATTE